MMCREFLKAYSLIFSKLGCWFLNQCLPVTCGVLCSRRHPVTDVTEESSVLFMSSKVIIRGGNTGRPKKKEKRFLDSFLRSNLGKVKSGLLYRVSH